MRILVLLCLIPVVTFAEGSLYQWIRQLGGSARDTVLGVALDPAGNSYVVGSSDSADFPVKNAMQPRPAAPPLYRIDGTSEPVKVYESGAPAIFSLTFSPCDDRTLYAGAARHLLRSQDLGATWERFRLPGPIGPHSIAVSCDQPLAPAVFITGGDALYRTRDLEHWDRLSVGTASVYQVWVDPHRATNVYARTTTGLARSENTGDDWRLTGTWTYGLAFDHRRPGVVYAMVLRFAGNTLGVEAVLPARSTDYAVTWTPMGQLPGRDTFAQLVLPDPARDRVLYSAGYSGFFISRDDGQTWTATPLDVRTPVAVDTDSGVIYAGTGEGVVATRDGFDTLIPLTSQRLPLVTALTVRRGVAFASTYGARDLFVTKLDPSGEVVYSTYFGGTGEDLPTAMTVGPDGSVHVAGVTSSSDFPAVAGPVPRPRGEAAGFLAKLHPDGNLAYSLFLSGRANAIEVDAGNNAIVVGTTSGDLTTTPSAYQTGFRGTFYYFKFAPQPTNAFVTKLTPDGSSLIYSTYLGEQTDTGAAMVLGDDGSVYVGGMRNLFHLSPDGSALLGSVATAPVSAMARNRTGSIYAATSLGLHQDGVNIRQWTAGLQVAGTRTIRGATNGRIAVDGNGNLVIAGSASPDFDTVAPLQGPFSPQTGFLGSLRADLADTLFTTFAGDRRVFSVASTAASPDGAIVFAGSTEQTNVGDHPLLYPFRPEPGADSVDVFVGKLTLAVPGLRLDSIANAASFKTNPLAANETVLLSGVGFGEDAEVLVDGEPAAILSRSTDRIVALLPAGFRRDGAAPVEISSGGARSNTVLMPAASGSPGVFSENGSGQGQGYILNADGTRNNPSNPAAEGERITIYVNGGTVGVPAAAFVNGFAASVVGETAGAVDGLPGIVYKLAAVVPRPSDMAAQDPIFKDFKMPPTVSVHVVAGGVRSQNGITMSLKPVQ